MPYLTISQGVIEWLGVGCVLAIGEHDEHGGIHLVEHRRIIVRVWNNVGGII